MRNTKTLVTNLPILTVAILIVSIVKLTIYYNTFGIPIKYFLTISEIGIYVAEDLLIFGLAFFLNIISDPFEFMDGSFFKAKTRFRFLQKQAETKIPAPNEYTFWYFFGFPMLILPMCFTIAPSLNRYVIVAVSMLYFILCIYYTDSMYYYLKINKLYIVIILTLALIGYESLALRSEIIGIHKGVYTGTIIEVKDKPPYVTNDSLFFIGKTSDYLFLYNKKDSTATILPTTVIDKIILRKKTGNFLENLIGIY